MAESKRDALHAALEEIDKREGDDGHARSIEERKQAALERLSRAYKNDSSKAQEDAAKAEVIMKSNQDSIQPITSDLKTIGDAAKKAGDTAAAASDAYKSIKSKMSADAGKRGAKSLIGKAAQNLFEFPVFMSSSVPLDYATAVNSLLEQMYASFLQMAVSINPVVPSRDLKSGKAFQKLKTDVTKYMEYTEFDWARAACHNVVYMEDSVVEFDMINISAAESNMILEAASYEPLSEFDHFFMEGKGSRRHRSKKGHQSRADQWLNGSMTDPTDTEDSAEESPSGSSDDTKISSAQPSTSKPQSSSKTSDGSQDKTKTAHKSKYEDSRRDTRAKIESKDEKERAKIDRLYEIQEKKDKHLKAGDEHDLAEYNKGRRTQNWTFVDINGNQHTMTDDDFERFQKAQEELRKEKDFSTKHGKTMDSGMTDANGRPILVSPEEFKNITAMADEQRRQAEESRKQAEEGRKQSEEERAKERHIIAKKQNARDMEKHAVDMKVKAPQMLDETKIQKLNTMKPLMMTVGLKGLDDDGRVSDMVDYVVGVRTHCRVVKAEILPDVAEYPLKEMSTLTRRAKWRAGEIKFLDFLVAKKEKKQAAYDSRDINRKWYHRLYTLAHSKGSKSIASKITGKGEVEGLIPNATIVVTKSDVDMVKAEKNIDLLNPSTARSFCSELFLMAFIVIDIDAQSINILLPDINKNFDVQSLAAVQKQIATLDTSGTVSREVSRLMNGR